MNLQKEKNLGWSSDCLATIPKRSKISFKIRAIGGDCNKLLRKAKLVSNKYVKILDSDCDHNQRNDSKISQSASCMSMYENVQNSTVSTDTLRYNVNSDERSEQNVENRIYSSLSHTFGTPKMQKRKRNSSGTSSASDCSNYGRATLGRFDTSKDVKVSEYPDITSTSQSKSLGRFESSGVINADSNNNSHWSPSNSSPKKNKSKSNKITETFTVRKNNLSNAVRRIRTGFLVATKHRLDTLSRQCTTGDLNCSQGFLRNDIKLQLNKSKCSPCTIDGISTLHFNVGTDKLHCRETLTNIVGDNSGFITHEHPISKAKEFNFCAQVDSLFSALEHLHDRMELVRNGMQQLLDHFTNPCPITLGSQENIMLQFKNSIDLLQYSIQLFNYTSYSLPDLISRRRFLLFPCRNTIFELNEHVQSMSIDFEHTRYFNNESPILTLLKMLVVINLIKQILNKGTKEFLAVLDSDDIGSFEELVAFDLETEKEKFFQPAYELLVRRTDAMIKLSNFSVVLYEQWIQHSDWMLFLPTLHAFMHTVREIEPQLRVSNDWYVIRILPETRMMHMFDGFMSEFYRAIVTPEFATNNPEAFGAIFIVLKYILDNVIGLHMIILGDLRRMIEMETSSERKTAPNTNLTKSDDVTDLNTCGKSGNSAVKNNYVNLQCSCNVPESKVLVNYENL